MIAKQVAKEKLLFCCLQEVRYRNSGKKIINLDSGESFIFFWFGQKKRRDAGVGIMIRKCNGLYFDEPDFTEPRIMGLNIHIRGFKLRVITAYAPTNCDESTHLKDSFYRQLRKACVKQHKHQKVIVCGDFNATTAVSLKQTFYDGKSSIEDPICNDNGARLKSFCRQLNLCMSQTYFSHQLEDRYTWHSGDGITRKVIDYVLVETFTQQFVQDCFVEQAFDIESDHKIIITQINTPTSRMARRIGRQKANKSSPKPNSKSLQDPVVKGMFMQKVTQELCRREGVTSSKDLGDSIVESLNTAAEATLPKMEKNQDPKQIWKDDQVLNHLLNSRKCYMIGSERHKQITKQIKTRVRTLRNEKYANEAAEINKYAKNHQVEDLYRTFKSENSSFKEYKANKKCDPAKLKDFFHKHFSATATENDPIELENAPAFMEILKNVSVQGLNTSPPNAAEITTTIKKLKDGKSSNDVPIAFIKHAIDNPKFMDEMVKLYATIWETLVVPVRWGHSRLVTLWKGPTKGKAEDASTYRGLQIGSSLCKILVMVIIHRLESWYEQQLLDQQQGFRPGRGTTDGIFIAKSIQQITNKMKKTTYLLFVDLTAAFDHVERSWLFQSIRMRFPNESSKTLIKLLEALYSYTTAALTEMPDDEFQINVGVRQGGPESPMLYNLYMDFVMRVFLDKCRERNIKFLELKYRIPQLASSSGKTAVGSLSLDWCGYADDLLLVFNDLESLQNGIKTLDETFHNYRLKINISKTKTMILNQDLCGCDYPKSIATLHGKPVENVKVYRYLGSEINYKEPTTGTTELTLRTDAAECKFYSLAKSLMNKKINLKTRTLMLDSLVRSRITYSCQTWSTTKTQLAQMNSLYMSFIRKMVNGGYRRRGEDLWSFLYTNVDLLRMSGASDLTSFIQQQQYNYVMKIIGKRNDSIVKRLMFNDNTYHKQGPQTTLMTSVLRNQRCTADELLKRAKIS